jgi:hypothetical protein
LEIRERVAERSVIESYQRGGEGKTTY